MAVLKRLDDNKLLTFFTDGEQRMRTTADQLQMRTLYAEQDLISAEIQNIGADGQISLHTRSMKYGKLENGQLIIAPSSLVKRLAQHYISFPWGVDVILGRNGYIWITSKCDKIAFSSFKACSYVHQIDI
jgi:exosome complex RNA-binding protein Rrp4